MQHSSQQSYRGRGRGRGRGTTGGFGGPRADFNHGSLGPERNILSGLSSDPLKTIPIPNVNAVDDTVAIDDLKLLASYNWVKDAESPTIIVPGSPPELQTKQPPFSVSPDIGFSFVDQNGFRMPNAVLQPLIAAVDTHLESKNASSFKWSSADFVTDRNNLRKLLRWINSPDSEGSVKPFRIDTQLAGTRTVLFNRWEKRHKEQMSGYTFGFNFEKVMTQPAVDCEGSSSHHRIVTYDLNGLALVVRFEVDACLPAPHAPPRVTSRQTTNPDDLISSLSSLAIKSKKTPLPVLSTKHGLTILKGGEDRPQSSIAEIATLSELRDMDWEDKQPQLYLSQTPHHILGRHTRGRFSKIERRDLHTSPDLKDVATLTQPSLKKLRKALEVIQDLVVEHGQIGRLTLVFHGGELRVYERDSKEDCLPDAFMERFDN